MKITKKRFLCKLLAYILSVFILSVSIGDRFIVANDIRQTEAASIVIGGTAIAVSTLAEICLFVGATAVTVYCVGEIIDNREEIARFGYDMINSCSETVDGWILSITDTSGQEYVYGTEALDLIRDTDWEVIQGGLPPDDNNDDDNNKGNGEKPIKNPLQDLCNFTALGATWLYANLSELYQKWVNGEPLTEAEQAVLAPVIEASCDQYGIARQWGGQGYVLNMSASTVTMNCGVTHNPTVAIYSLSTDMLSPSAYYMGENGYWLVSGQGNDLVYSAAAGTLTHTDCSNVWSAQLPQIGRVASFSANVPIFATQAAAIRYLEGTGPVTDALNYAKTYRNADWLQEDWAGVLIDSLCNVNLSLSQLVEVAKRLGLHAIGNNLSPQELYELIEDLLAGIDLSVLPEIPSVPAPVPDPGLDPVYLPSPDAHPIPNPGTTPSPGPGTKPDPGTNPDPGTDPLPGADIDPMDYQTDLRGLFPFCIPFDFVALLNTLDADPVAPCFTYPVSIPALDYREDITLDMSVFDDVAKVIRICEKVSFLIFLMFATSKVIRW